MHVLLLVYTYDTNTKVSANASTSQHLFLLFLRMRFDVCVYVIVLHLRMHLRSHLLTGGPERCFVSHKSVTESIRHVEVGVKKKKKDKKYPVWRHQ